MKGIKVMVRFKSCLMEVVLYWYRGLMLCGSVLVYCKYICLVLILKDVGFVGWCVINYRLEIVIYVFVIDFFFL